MVSRAVSTLLMWDGFSTRPRLRSSRPSGGGRVENPSHINPAHRFLWINRCAALVTESRPVKQRLILLLFAVSVPLAAHAAPASWARHARNVEIIRDDWGIAHVYGKTDADAVFGMIYAQAEDDFNRVERNYLLSIGRLAEAEGEAEIYRDLRMKLFIDPAGMKAKYRQSPAWLKALMDAGTDGLTYYLARHPEVKPKVIAHFEPWMALTFTEGSIGGDIQRRGV